ncbi:hypothetical protein KCP69_15960 [Salmonella enterica subsp. enterica]|nr:hypothetical protein KCP69_15960 [Salmonella enterica subsp. enterica]
MPGALTGQRNTWASSFRRTGYDDSSVKENINETARFTMLTPSPAANRFRGNSAGVVLCGYAKGAWSHG